MIRRLVVPAVFAMVVILPVAAGFLVAVLWASGITGMGGEGATLAYWVRVLGGRDLWWSLGWSAIMAVSAVGVSGLVALGLVGIRAPDRHVAGLMAIPGVVAAFLVFRFGGDLFVKDPWGLGILLAHVLILTPFLFVLVRQAERAANLEALRDLARMVGAGPWKTLRHVTLPVLWHRLRFHVLLLCIAYAGSFEIPLLLGRSWPEAISVLAYQRFSRFTLETRPDAFVIVAVYMVLTTGLFVLAWRSARRASS